MSGILDTFFFIFESDAKKLNDGLKESDKASDSLEKNLIGLDGTASKLGENFIDLAKKFAGIAAGALTLTAVKSLVLVQADLNRELGITAQQTRVDVETFSVLSRAVVNVGGDVGAFTETLKMLGERGRDPVEMLKQLQGRFQGLSEKQALRLGQMLGLDLGTINLLRKTKQELAEYIAHQRELGVVTKEQVFISTQFTNQLRDTGTVIDDVRRRISVFMLPALESVLHIVERTTIWFRDNSTFSQAFFIGIAGTITAIYMPAILRATVATFAFLSPWLLLIGAVALVGAAFALAYDDVQAFLAGNDSAIGRLAKRWPIVGEAVKDIVAIMEWAKDAIGSILKFIVDAVANGPEAAFERLQKRAGASLEKLIAKFPGFRAVIEVFTDAIGVAVHKTATVFEFLGTVIDKIVAAFKAFKSVFVGGGWEKFFNTTPTASNNAPAPKVPTLPQDTAAALAAAKTQLTMIGNAPVLAQSTNSILNNRNTSKTITVQVGGVTIEAKGEDAPGIAQSLAQSLGDIIKDAINHHDDGLIA